MERTGRSREAESYYRRALDVAPGYSNAACFLGQLLAEQGRLEEALEPLRRGLEANPYHEVCSNHLLATLANLGRVGQAQRELERATAAGVAIDPRLAVLIRGLGADPADDAR